MSCPVIPCEPKPGIAVCSLIPHSPLINALTSTPTRFSRSRLRIAVPLFSDETSLSSLRGRIFTSCSVADSFTCAARVIQLLRTSRRSSFIADTYSLARSVCGTWPALHGHTPSLTVTFGCIAVQCVNWTHWPDHDHGSKRVFHEASVRGLPQRDL